MKKHGLIAGLLLLLAACSQNQPAPIEDLGKKSYGRGNNSSYDAPTHENYGNSSVISKSNVYSSGSPQSASVSSVGETDLAPVQGGKFAPATSNSVSTTSNDSHIGVSDEFGSSPFSTPSKPLEKPVAQPTAPAPETAAPAATKIYDKDGITLIWPVIGGKVTSHFKGTGSDGINISISEGEPIVAAASGTVVYSGNDLKDYGNMVILRHDNSWLTAYANANRIAVKKGAYVKQGDIIAYVGSSGGVKTPQLHFALRKGKTPVDPEQYLPKN